MLSSYEEIIITSTASDESASNHDDQLEYDSIQNSYINLLKNLQISYNQIECDYLKKVNELEYKFHEKCSNLFVKRTDIINGKYEPNDDECRLKINFIETIDKQTSINDDLGIPSFWLKALKQTPIIAEMIEEWDEPLLRQLNDIKLNLHNESKSGFTLEFHFNEHAKEYFHNDVLTKFYEIQIQPDVNDDMLFYEGTAIINSVGCQIDWINSTRNLTQNNETGEIQKSFFNFFATNMIDDDYKFAKDFQIGYYIRENIIPKAILYYTGEIFDDEYEFTDDDNGESSDEQDSIVKEKGEGEHL